MINFTNIAMNLCFTCKSSGMYINMNQLFRCIKLLKYKHIIYRLTFTCSCSRCS